MLTNSSLLKEHGYVNGQWVGDDAKSRFDVTNAYSNEVISSLPDMGKKETDEAIEAANNAWPAWRTSCLLYTSPSPRDMRRSRMPSSA